MHIHQIDAKHDEIPVEYFHSFDYYEYMYNVFRYMASKIVSLRPV